MSKKIDEMREETSDEEQMINESEEKNTKFVNLGAKLKKLREAQGISISDVANHTKIQQHFIASIEEGKLDKLPKGPYLRGFLRQYCAYLSADDLWKTYDVLTKEQKVQFRNSLTKEEQVGYTAKPRIFKPTPIALIYIIVILSLLAASFITWQFRSSMSFIPIGKEETFSVQSEDMQASVISVDESVISSDVAVDLGWMDGKPLSSTLVSVSADLEPVNQLSVAKVNELKIIPTAVVWIRVSQANEILFQGLIKPGEDKTFTVIEEAPLRLKSGKPGKTSLDWQGKHIESMGDNRVPIVRFYWFDGRITETDQN